MGEKPGLAALCLPKKKGQCTYVANGIKINMPKANTEASYSVLSKKLLSLKNCLMQKIPQVGIQLQKFKTESTI